MSDKADNKKLRRRKIIKSVGAGGAMATGMIGLSGSATAKGDTSAEGSQIDAEQIDTSDWQIDLEDKDGKIKGEEIYVGTNKNADPDADSIAAHADRTPRGVTQWSVSSSVTVLTWDVPHNVPVLGGGEISLEISASATAFPPEGSIGVDLCYNGSSCFSVAGVAIETGGGEIELDFKGTFSGVPFAVEGTIEHELSVQPLAGNASVDVTASAQLCLGRDWCDKDAKGWKNYGCALCASASHSQTIIDT